MAGDVGQSILIIPGISEASVTCEVAIGIVNEDFGGFDDQTVALVRGDDVCIRPVIQHGHVGERLPDGGAGICDREFITEIIPIPAGALGVYGHGGIAVGGANDRHEARNRSARDLVERIVGVGGGTQIGAGAM